MSHRFALICAALAAGTIFPATAADATVTINVTEIGSDVVATANGTLDLTGLSFGGTWGNGMSIAPDLALIDFGNGSIDLYVGVVGPSQFGSGGGTAASASAGDSFALYGAGGSVWVPNGYIPGSAISSTDTFLGMSFASLGLTPGQYVYSWSNDTVTINIGDEAGGVPEPSTWAMMLIGFAAVGFGLRRRRRAGTLPQPA